jgi:hypothetical protein
MGRRTRLARRCRRLACRVDLALCGLHRVKRADAAAAQCGARLPTETEHRTATIGTMDARLQQWW